MEVRGRQGSVDISTPNPSKPVGPVALRNFIIPRKKRESGQVLLETCTEESRDYTLIQAKLRESRLDLRKEHANTWLWKNVRLVNNDEFLKEFSQKRSEMRSKGRHGREMEEHFCFLVASYDSTNQIYKFGLRTGSQDQYSFGKPSHGVYLFKHVDVALKHATASSCSAKNLIVFKVLYGKVKKVTPSLDWNRTVDPVVGFDCHMAKDAASHRDSLSQQVLGSLVFLFDYNENQELATRPRQCVPYAVVSFAPAISATTPTSTSSPVSPIKPPAGLMHGPLEHLKGCTVAKRTGKGEKATVIFKRFATPGCSGVEYQSQTPRTEANGVDPTPFQYNDLHKSPPVIPQQPYVPHCNTKYFNSSLPYYDNGISWQNNLGKSSLLLKIQNQSTTGICEGNTDTLGVMPQPSAEKISTIVYSSRLVKDPRLSRQETNIQRKSTEDERASSISVCEEQQYQAHSQNRKEEKDFTLSYEKQSVEVDKEHKEGSFPQPLLDDSSKSSSISQTKTENMPSIKFLKTKFQKYAQYFRMTEEERHTKIWSRGNKTPEENQLLIDRIHFYEMHHQRYKQGLLFQKDTETDTACSKSQTEPQNDVCPSTLEHSPLMEKGNQCGVNQSHMRHSVSADVSVLTPTQVLVDTERTKVDILDTDHELNQNICRAKENGVQEKEKYPSSDSQTEPQQIGVVQSVNEKEKISEMFAVQSTMESKPSDKTLESTNDSALILCPPIQVEINKQDVDKREIPTSPKEFLASRPTLRYTVDDFAEFEQHTVPMEVANCVDISATDVVECNDYSYAAMEQVHNSHSSTENQNETFTKSDTNSEMSIEVERGEAQQHNTIYNALYNRLQLDQLLSDSHEANFLSNKSYLRPKVLNKSLDSNLLDGNVDEPRSKEENRQFIVKLKSSQIHPERLMLSERFTKLRCLGRKLAAFVYGNRLASSYTAQLNGYLKCKPEVLISCSDGGKGTGNNNTELIKLLAQRYNGNRLIAKCKCFRKKRSKVLCRKSAKTSGLSKRTSVHLPFCVQRKTTHIRKTYLQQAKSKSKTKLALKGSSSGQASFSNLTSVSSNGLSCIQTANDVDSDLHLNSATASQSQSDSVGHGKLLNNDDATIVITEETFCVDSEKKTKHGDERSQTKEQCINSANQLTETVCQDVIKISNYDDLKKLKDNMSSDSKAPVISEEIETDSGTNNDETCIQEKSSLITCSGKHESGNESINDESEEAQSKEEALLQKKRSQEDNCDTKKISPDFYTGAYEDTSSPVPTVSSIPSDITSGNVISSCTDLTQTAMTPDSPRIINNETATEAKARIFGDKPEDNSDSGLTKSVLSTNNSEVTVKNANLQSRELHSNPKSTDSNEMGLFSTKEMSGVDQNYLKAQKCAKEDVVRIFTENTNDLLELTSGSQSQPSLQNANSSGITNSLVETTSYFHSKIIRDTQKDHVEIKDNLHLAWNGQDKNSLPTTSDTQIISKLRDYLTKFECTVKKQDTVSHSVTEAHVPTAWITLDSTAHKQQLHNIRHYSRQGLADITHQQSEPMHFQVPNTKHKQGDRDSFISKRRRTSNTERVSPDSTVTETVRNEPNLHMVSKDTQPHQITSGVPHWLQNHGNKLQESNIICSQVLGKLNRSRRPQGNRLREQPCQVNQSSEQTTYEKGHNMYIKDMFSVTDISNTLKLADHAVSLNELGPLQSTCKRMLQHFISNFEQDQKISFYQSCTSRNLILENYLDHPPAPVELKFEAINSFLELQMIMEACQFLDNKINFLKRKPTFRSLLWYDPALYGELYKGTVGFQQQTSLFSSFQQCLSSDDYRRLQEYYCAVSTLHQQLQDAPDTSYYMYLKTKRERLEIEAAFRNPSDVKSFFLSVPTAIMINLGDNLEILKKTHDIVMTFIETPADRLPGKFDVGKAEHLSIICRYLQEKILFLKSHKDITKISWFGMEHLLYDASKVLVWSESEQGVPNEVLMKYNRLNSPTVYGLTETCVALVNKIDHSVQPMDSVPPQHINPVRIPSAGVSTERAQTSLNIQMEDGKKETREKHKRRATHPCPKGNFSDSVTPLIQPSLAAQSGNSPHFTDFTQRSNSSHWRIPRTTWDWSPPDAIQSTTRSEIRDLILSKRFPTQHTKLRTTSLTDIQNSHPVGQQQLSQPLVVKPRPVERSKAQPTIGALQNPQLLKAQANEVTIPMIPSNSFPGFSPDATSVIPPPLPPFSSTSKQVGLHNNPTPISYPYFVFNGQTYSTTGSSVPVSALHAEAQYLPRPV